MTTRPRVMFLADDIWETPDDGNRYEVIDGELFVSAAPSRIHQKVTGKLYRRISDHVEQHRLGEVYIAPLGVVLDPHTGVEPDIIFVSNARLHILTDRGIEGVPDLVVEVLSPSTASRDRTIKLRRYATAGVPHYWIVDPFRPAIEAYERADAGYQCVATSGPGDTFTPMLFPGFVLAVNDLIA